MTIPRRYFPVQLNDRMPGPTWRPGDAQAGNLRIEADDERDRYLHAKRGSSGHWDSAESREIFIAPVTQWLADVIRTDQPAVPSTALSLDELVAEIQEDVVVLQRTAAGHAATARAVYVNVAFPSGWCPACAAGRSFLSLHAPVPASAGFDGAARKAAAELLFGGETRVRFVWTVTPDDTLDRRRCGRDPGTGARHPSRSFSWLNAAQAYLRVERQVIAPIETATTGFLIRVYHYPVGDLDPNDRSTLRAALLGMNADVRRYKGLAEHFDRIMALI